MLAECTTTFLNYKTISTILTIISNSNLRECYLFVKNYISFFINIK